MVEIKVSHGSDWLWVSGQGEGSETDWELFSLGEADSSGRC